MQFLLKHIRNVIYLASVVAVVLVYAVVTNANPSKDIQNIRITEIYALTALGLLYAALFIGLFYAALPNFPGKQICNQARQALGVSALLFGGLHAYNSFFYLLGGFADLGFLDTVYITSMILSLIALVILTVLAIASIAYIQKKMGTWWQPINRFVYLAGLLIVIHALMLGSHFIDLSRTIPQIFLYALLVLLILEALRIDRYLSIKFPNQVSFGPVFALAIFVLSGLYFSYVTPHHGESSNSLGVHSQHLAQSQQAASNPVSSIRYTVSIIPPENIVVGKDVTLRFKIYNANTGEQITKFDTLYEQLMHLVIVNNELDFFKHIHPVFQNGEFSVTTQFPKNDLYHLYLNFQPSGSNNNLEQQFGMTLSVGNFAPVTSNQVLDTSLIKTFGAYKVTLEKEDDFRAKDMSIGLQTLVFGVTDAQTGVAITNLQSYLGAFGHLTMINEKTFDYIHVHPKTLATRSLGSPSVEFLPLGLFGPIKPGTYRIFAEFSPAGHLLVADFTIDIK